MRELWRLVWRARGDPVSALAMHAGGVLVARGRRLESLGPDGRPTWGQTFGSRISELVVQDGAVGVLSGIGLHLLRARDGEHLSEGRAVPGGLRTLSAMVGGGWGALDHADRIHVFDVDGRGLRTQRVGGVRAILGWFDRHQVLVHAADGRLRTVDLSGGATQSLDERSWSWCSSLSSGQLVLSASEPTLWLGHPRANGWDLLREVGPVEADPVAAVNVADGWWLLGIDHHLRRLETDTGTLDADPADLLVGGGRGGDLVTASRDGVVQWFSAPRLGALAAEPEERTLAEDRRRYREDRMALFEAGRRAEDERQWPRAARLYQLLGRADDVARMVAAEEQAAGGHRTAVASDKDRVDDASVGGGVVASVLGDEPPMRADADAAVAAAREAASPEDAGDDVGAMDEEAST